MPMIGASSCSEWGRNPICEAKISIWDSMGTNVHIQMRGHNAPGTSHVHLKCLDFYLNTAFS